MCAAVLLSLVCGGGATASIEIRDDHGRITIGDASVLATLERNDDDELQLSDNRQIRLNAPKIELAGEVGVTEVDVVLNSGEAYCQRPQLDDSSPGCRHPAGYASAASHLDLDHFCQRTRLGHLSITLGTSDGVYLAYCALVCGYTTRMSRYTALAAHLDDEGMVRIDRCGSELSGNAAVVFTNPSPVAARLQLKQLVYVSR